MDEVEASSPYEQMEALRTALEEWLEAEGIDIEEPILGPEGMGDDGDEISWRGVTQIIPGVGMLSVHMIPVEGFVHYADRTISCLCGPESVMIDTPEGPIPHAHHRPLSGRYYEDQLEGV